MSKKIVNFDSGRDEKFVLETEISSEPGNGKGNIYFARKQSDPNIVCAVKAIKREWENEKSEQDIK